MVPHLTTALTGPINELEARILESVPAIERWFRLEWMEYTPPFHTAVDLRNAGFKLAPVGTNLFPSGFHNLTPEMLPLAVQAAMAAIEKICSEAKRAPITRVHQQPKPPADLGRRARRNSACRRRLQETQVEHPMPCVPAPSVFGRHSVVQMREKKCHRGNRGAVCAQSRLWLQ